MSDTPLRVITIPAKEDASQEKRCRQLRAAAYCRVSTREEDQLNSYAVQKEYYTNKIMSNPEWTLAGIYADKGISGTSAKKREAFMQMIKHCKQKKIDLVLTKSVSRFARNTLDCLYYTRALRALGIAVIFEKENINSLEEDGELRITLAGAFAQSESESISANVSWGIHQAMKSGKANFQYKRMYGFCRGQDGKPQIVPEEAKVVRWMYESYLAGASLRGIQDALVKQNIPCLPDYPNWTLNRIRGILENEKYCGDVLCQKTFRQDFISRKTIKNTGQRPMYLIENYHEGIISRETFRAAQSERARRNALKSSDKNSITGCGQYSSRYALTERLVCGECGTLYRRCTWIRPYGKRVVWRCISRLNYGKKYCKTAPTLDETPLQQAILAAVNRAMAGKDCLIQQITAAMEKEIIPIQGETISVGEIDRKLAELETKFQQLLERATEDVEDHSTHFKEILDEQTALKEKRAALVEAHKGHTEASRRMDRAAHVLENTSSELNEWNETIIRQLVEQVKVLSKDEIIVMMKGGAEVRQTIEYTE